MDRPIRILLVEDLAADAELITRALRRAGCDITPLRVETRAGLIEELARFEPDIVLSDFTLPGFDGLEALGLVRDRASGLPFVFVSGTLGEDRAIEALKRGATDYVLKNNLARLPNAVKRALDESANLRARQAAETAVRTSERRLRDIVEASQDWIWELDAAGRCTFSNGAARTILGYGVEELLGRDLTELLHPDDGWRRAGLLPDAAKGETAVHAVRARWLHRDGTFRWLERSATVVRAYEVLQGYRGNDRDVTRQLEHEARIARLNRAQILLSSVSAAVARGRERGPLLQEICRLAVERGGYARAIVALHDAPQAEPRPVAWHSDLPGGIETLALPLGLRGARDQVSLPRAALQNGRPAIADNLGPGSPVQLRHQTELRALGVQALAVLPLLSDHERLGVLSLESREPGIFDEGELAVLTEVAVEVVRSLQHFQREETLHFLSWYDPLTQLARRELFGERLALVCGNERDAAAAVVALDLDRIGIVNDSLGRDSGDEMLRIVANRLRTHLGNADRLAYLGGGTFAVALAGADAEPAGIAQSRARLREIFGESFRIGGRDIDMQIRTGVARYPQDANSATALVHNAETALRRAKASGLEDYDYTVTLNRELAERMLTGQRLHRALGLDQFLLHYQPIVDLETGRTIGAEALLRWNDPGHGLVPPALFVPLLEESGQIVEVGQWVFERVARDAALLNRAGIRGLRLAVNISPLQLRRPDFVDKLLLAAAEAARQHAQMEVEITESMLMQDLEASIEKLTQLRAAGIRVSIDDFGTGYSSLALLSRLPIDSLKIDRSFIAPLADDPAAMTVVSTVIGLGRSFRLSTVAEGVEAEDQLKLVRLMKCELGQGYLFGRPAPLAEFIARASIAGPRADD
jgi:diguanylate cyclase (GGDEF)-like protein/PAS domain S-box-containing protein